MFTWWWTRPIKTSNMSDPISQEHYNGGPKEFTFKFGSKVRSNEVTLKWHHFPTRIHSWKFEKPILNLKVRFVKKSFGPIATFLDKVPNVKLPLILNHRQKDNMQEHNIVYFSPISSRFSMSFQCPNDHFSPLPPPPPAVTFNINYKASPHAHYIGRLKSLEAHES